MPASGGTMGHVSWGPNPPRPYKKSKASTGRLVNVMKKKGTKRGKK